MEETKIKSLIAELQVALKNNDQHINVLNGMRAEINALTLALNGVKRDNKNRMKKDAANRVNMGVTLELSLAMNFAAEHFGVSINNAYLSQKRECADLRKFVILYMTKKKGYIQWFNIPEFKCKDRVSMSHALNEGLDLMDTNESFRTNYLKFVSCYENYLNENYEKI